MSQALYLEIWLSRSPTPLPQTQLLSTSALLLGTWQGRHSPEVSGHV